MSAVYAGHGRPERILRALAEHGPLSTPRLVELLAEGIEIHQVALTWYGQILRTHERAGRVARAGRALGAYKNVPSVIWSITGQGRERVAQYDALPGQMAAREAARSEKEEAAERERLAAGNRFALLAEAAATHNRNTPRRERAAAASALREAGCTLQQIGDAFGVTREMIRLDLLAYPAPGR